MVLVVRTNIMDMRTLRTDCDVAYALYMYTRTTISPDVLIIFFVCVCVPGPGPAECNTMSVSLNVLVAQQLCPTLCFCWAIVFINSSRQHSSFQPHTRLQIIYTYIQYCSPTDRRVDTKQQRNKKLHIYNTSRIESKHSGRRTCYRLPYRPDFTTNAAQRNKKRVIGSASAWQHATIRCWSAAVAVHRHRQRKRKKKTRYRRFSSDFGVL